MLKKFIIYLNIKYIEVKEFIELAYKYLTKRDLKQFFYYMYIKCFKTEIKELRLTFKTYFYWFFFKNEWTTKRILTLIIGWFLLIIPVLLLLALFYRIFIVIFFKIILYIIDNYNMYKIYLIRKKFDENHSFIFHPWKPTVKTNYFMIIHRKVKEVNGKMKMYTFNPALSEQLKVINMIKSFSVFEHKFIIKSLEFNKLSNTDILIKADDVLQLFNNLSKNKYSHYLDNYNLIFLIYYRNWGNEDSAKYMIFRKKFIEIIDIKIPFWFFYIFTWDFWKKFIQLILINFIAGFINRIDKITLRILKMLYRFSLSRVPRFYFYFIQKIIIPLDYKRQAFENFILWIFWNGFFYLIFIIKKYIYITINFIKFFLFIYPKLSIINIKYNFIKFIIKLKYLYIFFRKCKRFFFYYYYFFKYYINFIILLLKIIFFNIFEFFNKIFCWILLQFKIWQVWVKYFNIILYNFYVYSKFYIKKIYIYIKNKIKFIYFRIFLWFKFKKLELFFKILIFFANVNILM